MGTVALPSGTPSGLSARSCPADSDSRCLSAGDKCSLAPGPQSFHEGSMKMNAFLFYFVILSLAPFGSALDYRGLFGNWFGGGVQSPCTGCPLRNCLNDRAVVLGYCCGCARVSDFLPIDCPGLRLNCPSDGRRLCRDYDYMLNCCCP